MNHPRSRATLSIAVQLVTACTCLAGPDAITAPDPAAPENPLHYQKGPLDLKFSLEACSQGIAGSHAFWGLAQTLSPAADYPTDHQWLETYVKPAMAATYKVSDAFDLYGGVALVGSGTLGTDYFEEDDESKVLPENAFLGIRWRDEASDLSLDLSGGQQPFALGNQLLLSVGAGNGFERGCLTTFPYRAWEMAGLARASWGDLTLEGFYLDPNELASNDLGNRLAGVNLKWEPAPGQFAGVAFIKVLESGYPYAQAPVIIIPDAREGLESFDAYWKWAPTDGPLAGFSFLGETVIQRNDRVNLEAWGTGIDIGYRFAKLPFQPRLSYSPRYFTGDDPDTAGTIETFDPLFYMASPDTWASGGSSSLAFFNSNIIAHRGRLELTLTPKDFLNLNYWFVQAAERNSPLQFGQAARVTMQNGAPVLVSGVPDRDLSHELYIEYIHMFNEHVFLTLGAAGSFPADGLSALVPSGAENWWGGLVNLTMRF
jgi:hypothetical protein